MDSDKRKFSAIVKTLLQWFSQNARVLPWRLTCDPYAIWVSEIMLQQTQVKTVIPYWERWMKTLPGIADLARAESALIHKLWERLGYYTRVRNMQRAAQKIVAEHAGKFPRDPAQILELPGVGRYTAGAIASIAFNEPQPILDGNVIRVLTRWFGIAGNPKDKTVNHKLWELAQKLVERAATMHDTANACSHFNQSLMELGALICTPKHPSCLICPIRKDCVAFNTGRVNELPNLAPRVAATTRQFTAFVLEHRGKYLVQQRPPGVVNAHLWEFPNWERDQHGQLNWPRDIAQILPEKSTQFSEIAIIKHAITRYKITLRALTRNVSTTEKTALLRLLPGARWLTAAELHELAFSSAHQKIIMALSSVCDSAVDGKDSAHRRKKSRTGKQLI